MCYKIFNLLLNKEHLKNINLNYNILNKKKYTLHRTKYLNNLFVSFHAGCINTIKEWIYLFYKLQQKTGTSNCLLYSIQASVRLKVYSTKTLH